MPSAEFYISSTKYTLQERMTKRGKVYDVVFRIVTLDGIEKQKKLSGFANKTLAKQGYTDFVTTKCTLVKNNPIKKKDPSKQDLLVGDLIREYLASLFNQNKDSSIYSKQKIYKVFVLPYCDYTEPKETVEKTGTTVTFLGLTKLTLDNIENEEFEHSIITFFAKYLYLHKEKHLYINGKEISYRLLIDDSLSSSLEHMISGVNFKIIFIKWLDGSNRKSYAYYVDEKYVEKYREHTKCNNNAVKFYHSIFIESPYFNTFLDLKSENGIEAPNTSNDIIFKEIRTYVFDFAKTKLKQYVQNEVPGIIQSYIDEGLFPDFTDDPISLAQKEDLTSVVTSVYCIQPNIFYRTKKDSKKAIIGCLNLILKTDERDNIITILDSIQKLTPEERDQLADTLRKYRRSRS